MSHGSAKWLFKIDGLFLSWLSMSTYFFTFLGDLWQFLDNIQLGQTAFE